MKFKVKLRLKEIIAERQITQKELSLLSGLSENAIGNLVRGTAYLRMDTIEKLCTALRIPPSELIIYDADN